MPRPKTDPSTHRLRRHVSLSDATWQGLQRIAQEWKCSRSEVITRLERLMSTELGVTS
jgi:predicted DNA-binding ribbon-helix-helix protein